MNNPYDKGQNNRQAPLRTGSFPKAAPKGHPPQNGNPAQRPPHRPSNARPPQAGKNPNGAPVRTSPQRQRPVPQNAMRRSATHQKPPAKNLSLNLILAGILLALVIIALMVTGIRSCTKSEKVSSSVGENDIILNTEPIEAVDDSEPTHAKYTESSAPLNISSGYGILIDLDKNEVIASKGAEQRIYPASMTKLLTLIIACETLPDKSAPYTFTDAKMLDDLYIAGASVAGFKMNETVTVEDLIYGTVLPSGGDATNALATLIGGDEEGFALIMNEKIQSLGLKDTHFVTSSGLHDPDHYTTCHDMAVILEYAISDPYMRKVLGTYRYTTSKTEQHPDGILLTSTMYSRMKGDEVEGLYIQGGKTGYTNEALNCLASFAANCREDEALNTPPKYILVTAYGAGEYTPVFDAIDVYEKYCVD